MDKKVEILIIGTNKPIMETIARLINKEGVWNATIAFSNHEALLLLSVNDFKIVLFCAGITDELSLKEKILQLHPNVQVVNHYGGGSGLLFAEILQSLGAN